MSYSTIEARVKTLLESLGDFSETNDVRRGDFSVLDSGHDKMVVLMPGAFEREPYGGARQDLFKWTMFVWLFHRYVDVGTSYTNFQTFRQNVLEQVNKYPTLNALTGVVKARLVSGGEVTEIFDADDNGPFFIAQQLEFQINEVVSVTGGEYA